MNPWKNRENTIVQELLQYNGKPQCQRGKNTYEKLEIMKSEHVKDL